MNEKVAKALSYVDGRFIAEAGARKRRKPYLKIAVAAILAVAVLWNTPSIPLIVPAKAVSLASDSRKMERPNINSDKFDQWYDEQQARDQIVSGAVDPIRDFTCTVSQEVLSGVDDVNRLWSPINAYLALAMTAELTAGETQQQIMEALGVSQLEQLRENISAAWESVYQDNGREICVLANSLWLDHEVSYRQDVMDVLAHHYYASVYQGDLGSDRTNRAITTWLNNQTGGFLKDRTGSVKLNPEIIPMLAMASTVYFQAQWNEQFNSANNTEALFHAVSGDKECTFMNVKEQEMNYYWAEDYGAVQLWLENGSSMWLILPDEDKTADDVLRSGDYAAMITHNAAFLKENKKWMKVNLSLPKFDFTAEVDLKEGLQNIGVTKIFEREGNDFSPSIDSEYPVYLDSINQSARIAIDEEGVTAASYILLEFGAGAAAPPDEIIDFTLDRPFLIAICSGQIPLFIGTVNLP